jgi:hypothetical protein
LRKEALTDMKDFVQKIIKEYSRYLDEEARFERHLEMRETRDMRVALTELKIKIGTVESWFALLNADERIAFRQALQGCASAAMQSAAMEWMWRISKEGQTPWQLREQAVAKLLRLLICIKQSCMRSSMMFRV